MTDAQRKQVLDNLKVVKAGFDKLGDKYAGTIVIDKGEGITITVDRSRYEFTSQKAAKERAREMIEAIKAGKDTHKTVEASSVEPEVEPEDDGEGEGGEE